MVAFVTKRRETREARGGLCIDEDEASFFFRQLIWAVQFCHKNHVAHRWVWWVAAGSLFVFGCLCLHDFDGCNCNDKLQCHHKNHVAHRWAGHTAAKL
jgi:hypothetical protein